VLGPDFDNKGDLDLDLFFLSLDRDLLEELLDLLLLLPDWLLLLGLLDLLLLRSPLCGDL